MSCVALIGRVAGGAEDLSACIVCIPHPLLILAFDNDACLQKSEENFSRTLTSCIS